jgi:nondiscriminating aspartyl-tRNA synthetase
MQRILSNQLPRRDGRPVVLTGWIHRRRLLKSVAFLILRDRAGLAQVVVAEPATRSILAGLPEETVVRVTGQVRANPAAPGGHEVVRPRIEPLSDPAEPLPVELHRPRLAASLPTLLDHAPVALRHPDALRVFEASAAVVRGFRRALDGEGSPKSTHRSWSPRRPSPARTSSGWTTSVPAPILPRARSSTSS